MLFMLQALQGSGLERSRFEPCHLICVQRVKLCVSQAGRAPAALISVRGRTARHRSCRSYLEAQQHHKESPELLELLIITDKIHCHIKERSSGTSLPLINSSSSFLSESAEMCCLHRQSDSPAQVDTTGFHCMLFRGLSSHMLIPTFPALLSMSPTFVQDLSLPNVSSACARATHL